MIRCLTILYVCWQIFLIKFGIIKDAQSAELIENYLIGHIILSVGPDALRTPKISSAEYKTWFKIQINTLIPTGPWIRYKST